MEGRQKAFRQDVQIFHYCLNWFIVRFSTLDFHKSVTCSHCGIIIYPVRNVKKETVAQGMSRLELACKWLTFGTAIFERASFCQIPSYFIATNLGLLPKSSSLPR